MEASGLGERWEDLIIETISRILIPFLQLYSLYVLAHGHSSPGGGFQGGCIFSGSLILMMIVFGREELRRRLPDRPLFLLCALGVGIFFAGTGALCMAFGGEFLNYGFLDAILPRGPVMARYYGMAIVETGVQITVMAVMVSIFLKLLVGEEGCSSNC
ncbi:MAG: sodium:proton antiporter [Deltaproteobacteria bacterium]|nr:MAG: sodium:proton antiporter [Deltaproteobacteria bacterium]